ncbi:MAG TPA: 4-oxalocrotonate tautomerase family protein [Methanoregulaceae archaeon]|nr:4-oxalocrotonate tautomerase family protein [Methanoregulaceae archaeon]HOV67127.1 4-oxalocrotonate tautomerase family protein [Methanoregulaceae archaeon]HQJ88095.1 4-oxalocrotonate tautomerase family protein [Methanoregulaceae archaeon]
MPVVTIRMSGPRTIDQKRQIVEGVTSTLVEALGVDPSLVTVLLEELDRENIGRGGRLLADG